MLRPISDGPPYEPRELTGDEDMDFDIKRAFQILGHIVENSNLDYDDRARLPVMILGVIHNLTLDVNELRRKQVTVIQG